MRRMKYPDVMTVTELAEFLRLPLSSVYRLVREGVIPGRKVGRHWRFSRKAMEQWLGYPVDELQLENLGAQYEYHESFDISEQAKLLGKFDVRVNQLASGKFNGKLESVKTPHTMMYTQYWGRKAEVYGVAADNYLFLGAGVDWRGAGPQWCGTTIDHQRFAVSKSGDCVDYVIPDRCYVAALMMNPDWLVRAVGRPAFDLLVSRRTTQFSPVAGGRLIAAVTGTIRKYAKHPELMDNAFEVRALESRLLEIVNDCLEPSGRQDRVESASRRRFYVRKAIARIESADHPLTVIELAGMVGVSQRTLSYAFQQVFDMNPCTYLQLQRLNAAHKELIQTDPQATSITNIAFKWGFNNASRFSQLHKKFFDESPSQSLSRA